MGLSLHRGHVGEPGGGRGSLPVMPRDRYRRDLERECFSPRGSHWGPLRASLRGLERKVGFCFIRRPCLFGAPRDM